MSTELEDRRKFLAGCGRFAVITPPTITALLTTTLTSTAVMASSGRVGQGDSSEHADGRNWHALGRGGDDPPPAPDPAPAPAPAPAPTSVDLFAAPMTVGSPTMGTP